MTLFVFIIVWTKAGHWLCSQCIVGSEVGQVTMTTNRDICRLYYIDSHSYK